MLYPILLAGVRKRKQEPHADTLHEAPVFYRKIVHRKNEKECIVLSNENVMIKEICTRRLLFAVKIDGAALRR